MVDRGIIKKRMENMLIDLTSLAKLLNMDKSNLHKIIKRLKIEGTKIRVVGNRWGVGFDQSQIEQILEYRKGIPHNLKDI